MNIFKSYQIAHAILNPPNNQKLASSDKIAALWILSNLLTSAKDYDLFFRLQILEGAFGIPEGHWWNKGLRGLKEATKAAEGTDIQDVWLSPKESNLFRIIYAVTNKLLKSMNITGTDADDITQSILMGIGINSKNIRKKTAYEIGKVRSKTILNGNDTPAFIAKGILSKSIQRFLLNTAVSNKDMSYNKKDPNNPDSPSYTKNKHINPVNDQGQDVIEMLPGKKQDAGELLTNLLFKDRTNPLGKKLRNFMRNTWKGTNQEQSMNSWLDEIEKGKKPRKKDIAQQSGISPQTFSQRHWPVAWHRFFDKLWKNKRIINDLQTYYMSHGVTSFPSKPSNSDIQKLIPIR